MQLCCLVQRPVLACPSLVPAINRRDITHVVTNSVRAEVSEADVLDEQGVGVQIHPRRWAIALIATLEPPSFPRRDEGVIDPVTIKITDS